MRHSVLDIWRLLFSSTAISFPTFCAISDFVSISLPVLYFLVALLRLYHYNSKGNGVRQTPDHAFKYYLWWYTPQNVLQDVTTHAALFLLLLLNSSSHLIRSLLMVVIMLQHQIFSYDSADKRKSAYLRFRRQPSGISGVTYDD